MDFTQQQARTIQPDLVGAIDQGTSSTRFLVFAAGTGELVTYHQIEIQKIIPQEGWVEIDPMAIIDSVYRTIEKVESKLQDMNIDLRESVKCIGICNQRESTVVWDPQTGRPYYNVIAWMDNRTKNLVDKMIDADSPGRNINFLKDKTGLPMSTYFSAFKLKWLLTNVCEVREALANNRLMFGTVDTWILWNLTGGHLTDVTNASRTFLMDIETLEWDKSLCQYFDIPMSILPKIRSSADTFGEITHGPLKSLPVTGVIGDQSGALIGHNCLSLGQTKATFGTGCFIMQNIGVGPLQTALSGISREAKQGLVTTVGYKLGINPACYALEGSVKIAGAAITWLRDNLELIGRYEECDELVDKTPHSAGVYFVPALGGLYSPYWDPNAAGLFIGLSQFTRRGHIIRATFDSIAYQTNEILSIMRGVTSGLMIDGGMCKSDNMCQILADITGCDIVRPSMTETSALGAAMVAGYGAGIWKLDAEHLGGACGRPYQPQDHFSASEQQMCPDTMICRCDDVLTLNSRSQRLPIRTTAAASATIVANRHESERILGCGADQHEYIYGDQTCLHEEQHSDSDDVAQTNGLSNHFRSLLRSSRAGIVQSSHNYCNSSGYSSDDGVEAYYNQHNHRKSAVSVCNGRASYLTKRITLEQSTPTAISNELVDQQVDNTIGNSETANATDSEILRRRNSFIGQCQSFPNCISSCIKTIVCPDNLSKYKLLRGIDVFQSQVTDDHRVELVNTWRLAVERSMKWTKVKHEELQKLDYERLASLPMSLYIFGAVGLLALSLVQSEC
ncbi:Glycerol kinase [Fragariocoptes setiger]|uniref:glycerol kinase n=1 Tax=Fragariocoptes setiger TaxID=1670756 RepID=A0ABQ7S873_9ACAR|nr:Glycerol kinase [Fragariocoptes setiger]